MTDIPKPPDLTKWRAGVYDLAGRPTIMCYPPKVDAPPDAIILLVDETPVGTPPRQIPAELKRRLKEEADKQKLVINEN